MSRAEVTSQMTYGERPHGTSQFRIHRLLDERTEPTHRGGGFGRIRIRGRTVVETAREDMSGDELQETDSDVFHLATKFLQMAGVCGGRHACRMQMVAVMSELTMPGQTALTPIERSAGSAHSLGRGDGRQR
jgi:hypothetical protein